MGIKKKKKKDSDGESYTDYSDSENGSEIGDSGTTPFPIGRRWLT